MMAKSYYYKQVKQYELSVEYLLKVLDYYPNSGWASNALAEIYTWYLPDTRKYLQYALLAKKVNVDYHPGAIKYYKEIGIWKEW